MNKKLVIFLMVFSLMPLIMACTTNFMSLPSTVDDGDSDTSSAPPQTSLLAYCNSFHHNGFRGLLTAYYDKEKEDFSNNINWLYLFAIPDLTNPSNFIQIHRVRISNNREIIDSAPVEIKVIKNSSLSQRMNVRAINHALLDELGGLRVEDFLHEYSFQLQDLAGWEALSLTIFNYQNKPLKVTKVLIPPFASNPHTFFSYHNQETMLFRLHPSFKIADSNHSNDQVFYNKSREQCQQARVPVQVPPFEDVPQEEGRAEEELASDLLFFPSLN